MVPHGVEDGLPCFGWEVGHTSSMNIVKLGFEGPRLGNIHRLKGAIRECEWWYHRLDVDTHDLTGWVLGTYACHSDVSDGKKPVIKSHRALAKLLQRVSKTGLLSVLCSKVPTSAHNPLAVPTSSTFAGLGKGHN